MSDVKKPYPNLLPDRSDMSAGHPCSGGQLSRGEDIGTAPPFQLSDDSPPALVIDDYDHPHRRVIYIDDYCSIHDDCVIVYYHDLTSDHCTQLTLDYDYTDISNDRTDDHDNYPA